MSKEKSYEEYFEKFGIPWLTSHLQMRSTGLQLFTAIQGGLLIGWATHKIWAIPVAALVSCLSFYLWDRRVRHVLDSLTQMGMNMIDIPRFGNNENDQEKRGVFYFIRKTRKGITLRERLTPRTKLFKEGSHTTAIKVLLCGFVVLWLILLWKSMA